MKVGRLFASAAFAGTLACGVESHPPLLEGVGAPCRSEWSYCAGGQSVDCTGADPARDGLSVTNYCVGDELFECTEGAWQLASCTERCAAASQGYVAGACFVDVSSSPNYCICQLADPEGCAPGATRCNDDDTLARCTDAQEWETYSCGEICETAGYAANLGCGDGGIQEFPPYRPIGAPTCLCGT